MHAWTVPGVVSNGYLTTIFACTNTLSSSTTMGVEVFGVSGGAALNDTSTSSFAVAPGGTAVFGTESTAGFSLDSNLGLGNVQKGSARVLVTTSFKASQGILCSAILADPGNSPPTVMTTLPVIKKTTQQGD